LDYYSDFATQHEAVRNAFRIALETNRTLILPQIRLGNKDIHWAPFTLLQKYYESQDKTTLKNLCLRNEKNWKTVLHPCRDLDHWIEMPWSSFFDLDAVRDQFGIRIYERTSGHGWGVYEPLLSHVGLTSADVIAVDPNSFPSNGSDWDVAEQKKRQVMTSSFFSLFSSSSSPLNEEEESLKLRSPLKMLVKSEQLLQMNQRYIQFGSLVFGLRFQTNISKQQSALQKALRSNVFVSPNQFHAVNAVAQSITETMSGLGGYNVIHMNLEKLVRIELENRRAMGRENAEIDGNTYVDSTAEVHPDGTPYSPLELLTQLDSNTQSDLMAALVLELQGDIPINQAVAAALPLGDSLLKDHLLKSPAIASENDRRSLLSACIDYRKQVDAQYPIYYLVNDVYSDIIAHPELFGPLIDAFPCTFTKDDIYGWGIVDFNWANAISQDSNINFENLLSPFVEILVARKGKYDSTNLFNSY
jgi:hypothetical protein